MTVELHLGDCLEYMKTMPAGSVDAVITDPPYGCGKADFDIYFPTEWYQSAKLIAPRICIITGSIGLKDSVKLMGEDLVDVIAARNLNALTRGPLGFSNWLACALSGTKPPQMQNFFEFAVRGEMPDHPSPKPIEYMQKLVKRVTNLGDTIFDPFMGSGTTGVACVQLGRNFIGCEIDPKYFEIAKKRIAQAEMQPQLFTEKKQQEKQEELMP